LERYDEAVREFRAAHLSESEAHCNLAFIYATRGRMEEAKQECRIARDLDPANAKAAEFLGELEHPSHPRDQTAGAGRPGSSRREKGGPRAGWLTAAQWEAEHEAARRAVGGAAPAPVGGAAPAADAGPVAPPAGPVAPPAGPVVMPSGKRWMPVSPSPA